MLRAHYKVYVYEIELEFKSVDFRVRGPYRLHPSLRHLHLSEEAWLVMLKEDKDAYVETVLQSDVYPEPVVEQLQSNVNEVETSEDIREVVSQLLLVSGDVESSDATGEETTYGLLVLAEAALNVSDNCEEGTGTRWSQRTDAFRSRAPFSPP